MRYFIVSLYVISGYRKTHSTLTIAAPMHSYETRCNSFCLLLEIFRILIKMLENLIFTLV